jgi:hypothetical protein
MEPENQNLELEFADLQGQPQADTLPDKYKGKSVEEIAKMHQEAEKLIGRQAQEVGELRRMADDFIRKSLEAPVKPEPAPEPEPDFFADPAAAVKHILKNTPEIRNAQEELTRLRAEQSQKRLQEAHADYESLLADPDFQSWVSGSKYRTSLFANAHRNWDFEAADELFSTYKELNKVRSEGKGAALRAASVPAGGTPSVEGVGNESGSGRKVYRRADLIRLQQTDPQRYAAMQGEIMAAYAEGRVR